MASTGFLGFARRGSLGACAVVCAFASAPPAEGATLHWTLYDASCSGGQAALEIECGNYGVFQLGTVEPPGGCAPIAQGSEDPPPYALPGPTPAFHVLPRVFSGGYVMHPLSTSTLAAEVGTGSGHAAAMAYGQPPNPPSGPASQETWIAVVDFNDAHGASTSWLVDEVGGGDVAAYLTALDDPALAALGQEVGDFHLLAKLCAIVEKVDGGSVQPPRVVNMSFGRAVSAGESAGPTACDAHRGSCQVARVIEHLRAKGSRFVAAAGNHQELLFPAALPSVLAAGMLDVTAFFSGTAAPAWETPTAAQAWIPGSALCLDGWAAPAGSSYASAMLSGWLSEVVEHAPDIDLLSGPLLMPRWHPTKSCFVLAVGHRLSPWCNDAIDTLFQGLLGASEGVCWHTASTPAVSLPSPATAMDPPGLPSASAWADETHPAPESDPCVPCLGEIVQNGSALDLVIDLSESPALPAGVYLDSVMVRSGSSFYAMPLAAVELDAIEAGTLAQLTLSGWGSMFATTHQPSLVYRLKASPTGDCSVLGTCYWSSTPVLLKP